MTPFEPKGDKARWKLIYDILLKRNVGDTITYAEMAEVLELDADADRHAIQMAVRRAAKEYESADLRALDSVPNEGYRIVEPTEHMRLARKQQKKSHKALQRGHSKVVHVDLSGLDPDSRKAFEVVAQAFAMQMDFNRRMDIRQKRLEQSIASVNEKHDRSAEEIEELKERLARLEERER